MLFIINDLMFIIYILIILLFKIKQYLFSLIDKMFLYFHCFNLFLLIIL